MSSADADPAAVPEALRRGLAGPSGLRPAAVPEALRRGLRDLAADLRRRAVASGPDDVARKPRGSRAGPSRSGGPEISAAGSLAEEAGRVEACRKCPLGGTRLKSVYGGGSPSAEVMFVGEGPGFEEDHRGEPFVGRAGQLLDKILASIGLDRSVVYIANMVKCHAMIRPGEPESRGNDRPPSPEEMAACREYLDRQIALIRPRVVVTLGAVAAKALLGTTTGISALRGRWQTIRSPGAGEVKVLPTYHPAALLRNPGLKRAVWDDMKALRDSLGGEREKQD